MAKCLVCGKHFESVRSDAKCCSSNCRHMLRRERKRRTKEYDARNYGLLDIKWLRYEQTLPPTLYAKSQELRLVFGKALAIFVLEMLAELEGVDMSD